MFAESCYPIYVFLMSPRYGSEKTFCHFHNLLHILFDGNCASADVTGFVRIAEADSLTIFNMYVRTCVVSYLRSTASAVSPHSSSLHSGESGLAALTSAAPSTHHTHIAPNTRRPPPRRRRRRTARLRLRPSVRCGVASSGSPSPSRTGRTAHHICDMRAKCG